MLGRNPPGGVVVVDGWIGPDDWRDSALFATLVDEPDRKVARVSRNSRDGNLSVMEWHVLIGTHSGVEHFVERHELGLFTRAEYESAFRQAGLAVERIDGAPDGRSRYVGTRPD